MEKPLKLCRVLCKTRRVMKSQRRALLALAVLFLLPSSLATVLVLKPLSQDKTPVKILLAVAYYLFSLFFSPLATASISYTAIHGFNGEPVSVKEAVKSATASYFPLLATALAVQFVIFFITTLGFALLATACITKGFLGIPASPYLLGFVVAIFASIVLYVQAIWTLASAIVVAESSWGFAALKRSKKLIKGKRGLALCLSLIFGLFYLLSSWNNYRYTTEFTAGSGGTSRPSVAAEWLIGFFSRLIIFLYNVCFAMLIQQWAVLSSAVLYVYCRAIESATAGELSGDYFSLLGDDDDRVASVV